MRPRFDEAGRPIHPQTRGERLRTRMLALAQGILNAGQYDLLVEAVQEHESITGGEDWSMFTSPQEALDFYLPFIGEGQIEDENVDPEG